MGAQEDEPRKYKTVKARKDRRQARMTILIEEGTRMFYIVAGGVYMLMVIALAILLFYITKILR